MKTLTVRMEDEDYEELLSIARSRGTTLSDLTRETLRKLREAGIDEAGDFRAREAPDSLSAVDRLQLSLLHRILARLVVGDPNTEDGDPAHQLTRAKVLESGWVSEYPDEFISIGPEVSRRETNFVMDVLEMFTRLEWSFEQLSEEERASLGSDAERRVQFPGFDFNDRREGRMASYARYLIDDGRWESMAKYFDDEHDRGNSHGSMSDMYSRMLEVFQPIWRIRLENFMSHKPGGSALTAEEIRRVTDAQIHPDNRR